MSKATNDLVDRFAAALKEKLAAAEQKYGYGDDWLNDDWRDELIVRVQEHTIKGDPRDVAAYCAFAWHHGWSITPPQHNWPSGRPMPAPEHQHARFARLCSYCNDTGMVAIRSRDGVYAFPGPVPDDARGYVDADCWYCDSGRAPKKATP